MKNLGHTLRESRKAQGLSLRGLADDVGVSASMLSLIENDRSKPSVATLFAIVSRLGISLDDVFDTDAGRAPQVATVDPLRRDPASRVPTDDGLPHVFRNGQGERLALQDGVVWTRLGPAHGMTSDFLHVTYDVGATSGPDGALMTHPGREHIFLISGELQVTSGNDEFILRAGDAASLDSDIPHGFRNTGALPALGLWFIEDGGIEGITRATSR